MDTAMTAHPHVDPRQLRAYLAKLPPNARNRLQRRAHAWAQKAFDNGKLPLPRAYRWTGVLLLVVPSLLIGAYLLGHLELPQLSAASAAYCGVAAVVMFRWSERISLSVYMARNCRTGRLSVCPSCDTVSEGDRTECARCGCPLELPGRSSGSIQPPPDSQ